MKADNNYHLLGTVNMIWIYYVPAFWLKWIKLRQNQSLSASLSNIVHLFDWAGAFPVEIVVITALHWPEETHNTTTTTKNEYIICSMFLAKSQHVSWNFLKPKVSFHEKQFLNCYQFLIMSIWKTATEICDCTKFYFPVYYHAFVQTSLLISQSSILH